MGKPMAMAFFFVGRFEARHFSGLFWSIIGVPPPDFEVVSDTTLLQKRWGVVETALG